MKTFSKWMMAPVIVVSFAACSQRGENASAAASGTGTTPVAGASGGEWASNGATACEKYLTADFVAQIFSKADGQAKRLSGWSCSYQTSGASIDITLIHGDVAAFEADQKNLSSPVPLSGVGDKAVNSATGVESVKGNRMCDIGVTPPFGNKLQGEALAQKLGEVCNTLFALP
ncbi:MAG: hypothetical protein ABI178_06520 [Rhodanobacter sp.]